MIREWFSKLCGAGKRHALDSELSEEIETHIHMQVEEYLSQGMSIESARIAARRDFGNTLLIREEARDTWAFRSIEDLWRDLRMACRRIRHSPGFVLTTILVLSLGLGANVTLFNAIYALLWRPLSFANPERLATLSSEDARGMKDRGAMITGGQAAALAEHSGSLEEIGLVSGGPGLTIFNKTESLDIVAACANSGYFRVLSLNPIAGRLFSEDEDLQSTGEQRAVLLESAWRKYFHGDSSIVGSLLWYEAGNQRQQIRILGIVHAEGTLPFASGAEILLPIPWRSEGVRKNYGDAFYRCVLQLKPGISLARASGEARPALANNGRLVYSVEPLRSVLAPVDMRAIFLLCGAALLLLVLMCANLASLFLARSMARFNDLSLRLALGASTRHLLTSNVMELALLCLAGTLISFGLNGLIRSRICDLIPDLKRVGPELLAVGPVLIFSGIVLWIFVAVVIAIPASLWAKKTGMHGALSRSGGTRLSWTNRWVSVLVIAQLSIVLTILTVGGLLERSFVTALRSDSGIDPGGVVTFHVSMPVEKKAILAAASDLTQQIEDTPGGEKAAYAAEPPLGIYMLTAMNAHGGAFQPGDPIIGFRMIGPQYLETLSARLLAGRTFSEAEVRRGDPIVLLNEAASRRLFGIADPVGRIVHTGFLGLHNSVVGVVKDIRHEALDLPARPMVYMPYRPVFSGGLNFVVQTTNVKLFQQLLSARVLAWNSQALVRQFRILEDTMAESVRTRLLSAILIGGFAILGLIISLTGLYGTVSSKIQRRRKEIGIRVALGALPSKIVMIVLGQGVRILAAGAVIGLAGSLAAGHWIRHLLYGVEPLDPASIAVALALLVIAALGACLIPAVAALRVDPVDALRAE